MNHAAVFQQRRGQGRDRMHPFREQHPHELLHRRTGRRDHYAASGLLHGVRDRAADPLGADRRFRDSREAEILDERADARGGESRETSVPRRRQRDMQFFSGGQRLPDFAQIVPNAFGVRGTNGKAPSAGDAEFRDHFRMGVLDPDGFRRAVPDALETVLAFRFRSVDRVSFVHGQPFPFKPSSSRSSIPGSFSLETA